MLNLDHPSRSTAMLRRRAARDRAAQATDPDFQPGNALAPSRKIGWIEILFWAFAIFLLTSPFTFWGMSADPVQSSGSDLSSMRTADGSQWRLYAMRAAVVIVAALFTVTSWRYITMPARRLWPFLPFFAWASLSILWSDSQVTSTNSVLALAMLVVASVLLCLRLTYVGVARAMVLSSIWLALISAFFALVLPDYGIHQSNDFTQSVHAGAWRGSYFHKNHLGQTCAVVAVALILANDTIISSRVLKWAMVAVMVALIVLSTSASGAVTVPLALALHWLFIELPPAKRLRALLYIFPAVVGGLFAISQLLIAIGRDITLTGRTEVWTVAWDWFSEKPLEGYGFNTLTYGGFSFELFRKRGLIDPHNGYFETAMGTGLVGLALFLLPLAVGVYCARKQYAAGGAARDASTVLSGVMIAWFIASFTEVDFRPFAATAGLGYFALFALMMMPPPDRTRIARPALFK